MQRSIWSYYTSSGIFTAASIAICYYIAGINGAFLALVLGILEVSLSLDNAVVNAKVIAGMDEKWKKRFLTWGMILAVFGMRLVFPILIVWATSSLTMVESVLLPFQDAAKYAETVSAAHVSIAGFGGAFLLMVFYAFFIDAEKEHHWIPAIEPALALFDKTPIPTLLTNIMISVLTIGGVSLLIPDTEWLVFVESAGFGILTYTLVQGLSMLLEKSEAKNVTGAVAKTGFAAFMYLEILDASFSFDGVIGAFAITNNILIIAIGLGIGAMFVRSMTIQLVDKGTLGQFKYLEHGAFWSIGTLAAFMFANVITHIPEVVTGLTAAIILVISVAHSIWEKKHTPVLA